MLGRQRVRLLILFPRTDADFDESPTASVMTTWGDLSRGVKGLSTNSDIFWIFPEPYLISQRNTSNKIDKLQVIRAFLQSPPTSSRAGTFALRPDCPHRFPTFLQALSLTATN